MQEGPRVKKCPIVIQFLGTYVIVMGVSMAMKLAYGPVHHGYIKNTSNALDVEVLIKITDRGP